MIVYANRFELALMYDIFALPVLISDHIERLQCI